MPFVRVKSAVTTDPQHEFDVPVAEVKQNPEMYTVVDPVPVRTARPASYAPKPSRPARKRAVKRTGGKPDPAGS